MENNRRAADPMLHEIKSSLDKLSESVYETRDMTRDNKIIMDEIKKRGCEVAAAVAGEMKTVVADLKNLNGRVDTADKNMRQIKLVSRIAAAVATGAAAWLATLKGIK